MAEGFAVRPEAVAGYSVLAHEVWEQLTRVHSYISEYGGAHDGYDGLILSALRDPVNGYATAAAERIGGEYCLHLLTMSDELNRTAWTYVESDELKYTESGPDDTLYPDGRRGGATATSYQAFPDPDPFPVSVDTTGILTAPCIMEVRYSDLDELDGNLKTIDWAVRKVTGWSPVEEITEQIIGNWSSLKASGEVLRAAGTALEEALSNLTRALPRLDAHWSGGAAQSFLSYLNGFVLGAGQDGPLNRLVGEAYILLANEIERVAGYVVRELKWVVDQIISQSLSFFLPGFGQYKLVRFVVESVDLFFAAKQAVDQLIELKNAVKQLIEVAKNPLDTVVGAIGELEKIVGAVDRGLQVGEDLSEVTKLEEWRAMPKAGYDSGADPRRPGA